MDIKISTDYIKLDSFLKYAALVYSGGEAKYAVLNGEVDVNGEVCMQRGKKLFVGDTVTFLGEDYTIVK